MLVRRHRHQPSVRDELPRTGGRLAVLLEKCRHVGSVLLLQGRQNRLPVGGARNAPRDVGHLQVQSRVLAPAHLAQALRGEGELLTDAKQRVVAALPKDEAAVGGVGEGADMSRQVVVGRCSRSRRGLELGTQGGVGDEGTDLGAEELRGPLDGTEVAGEDHRVG